MQPILLQPFVSWPWSRPPWSLPTLVHIRPSRDGQAKSQRSQDALALWHRRGTFIAVVCDGVSQSFYGDFAAWVLAEALVKLLRNFHESLPASVDLMTWGRILAAEVEDHYQALPMPSDLPPMMRQVLAEKRRLGSETMFAAVRVDLPSPKYPQGRLLVVQGGNIRVRVFGPKGEFSSPLDEERRWSTRHGFQQPPWLWETPLRDGNGYWQWDGVVIYTDGIFSLDRFSPPWTPEAARRVAEEDWLSPLSDDQAYVEMRWSPEGKSWLAGPTWPKGPEGPHQPQVERVEQNFVSWRVSAGNLYTRVAWQGAGRDAVWSTPESRLSPPAWAQQVRLQGVDVRGQTSSWTSWYPLQAVTRPIPEWIETGILLSVALGLLAYLALLLMKVYGIGW